MIRAKARVGGVVISYDDKERVDCMDLERLVTKGKLSQL